MPRNKILMDGEAVMSTMPYQGTLVSADSHVMESPQLWVERLPASLRDRAPRFAVDSTFRAHPGGSDPRVRCDEMSQDGVSAEVLYPTSALTLFSLRDPDLQEACFRVYNDWVTEYCSVAPDRLIGIAAISAYDIDHAVREVERCREAGMRGILVWQTPPEELGFETDHYEKLWAAAAELRMPVSLHILTGYDWSRCLSAAVEPLSEAEAQDRELRHSGYGFRGMTNYKLLSVTNALHDVIVSGALQRHPELRFVLVENEIGWIPFVLDQWDKYYKRPQRYVTTIDSPPSELFARQVYATFFNDPPGARQLEWWGGRNCMWSSDFPHHNSTWPNSRQYVTRHLGELPEEVRLDLTWRTCAHLYGLKEPVGPQSLSNATVS